MSVVTCRALTMDNRGGFPEEMIFKVGPTGQVAGKVFNSYQQDCCDYKPKTDGDPGGPVDRMILSPALPNLSKSQALFSSQALEEAKRIRVHSLVTPTQVPVEPEEESTGLTHQLHSRTEDFGRGLSRTLQACLE